MLWNYGIDTILHGAAYVLLVVICVWMMVRAMWPPLEVYKGPCCGGCGHGVRDILQGVCPECGGQYSKVGITTPGMAIRLRGSLPLALLAWTTIVLVAGGVVRGWLEQRAWSTYAVTSTSFSSGGGSGGGGGKHSEQFSTDFTPMNMGSTTFGRGGQSSLKEELEYRIALTLDTVTDGDKVESGTCVMKLRKNGEPDSLPLTIDLADGSFTIKNAKGEELTKGAKGEALDEKVVEKWFKAAGLDVEGTGVQRSIKDALKIVRYARSDPAAIEQMSMGGSWTSADNGALRSNGSSTRSGGFGAGLGGGVMPTMMGPPGIGTVELALTVGILGGVYIAGCGGIIWRNRRVTRRG